MTSATMHAGHVAGLLLLIGLHAGTASAQAPTLEQRLAAAGTLFEQLDIEAEACLQELEAGEPDIATQNCSRFLNTVDGEQVSEYLEHCSALTRWRDDFISSENEAEASAEELNRTVSRLRGVEFYCGEDALSRRTEFVQTAFNRLRSAGMAGASTSTQFQSAPGGNASRFLPDQSVYQSLQRERLRLRGETNQLWNDLEIELLRSQLERSRDYRGGR